MAFKGVQWAGRAEEVYGSILLRPYPSGDPATLVACLVAYAHRRRLMRAGINPCPENLWQKLAVSSGDGRALLPPTLPPTTRYSHTATHACSGAGLHRNEALLHSECTLNLLWLGQTAVHPHIHALRAQCQCVPPQGVGSRGPVDAVTRCAQWLVAQQPDPVRGWYHAGFKLLS